MDAWQYVPFYDPATFFLSSLAFKRRSNGNVSIKVLPFVSIEILCHPSPSSVYLHVHRADKVGALTHVMGCQKEEGRELFSAANNNLDLGIQIFLDL